MTPVGTPLTRTLPQQTLRQEEPRALTSGNEAATAEVRRWEVAESWSLDVSGLAKNDQVPLGRPPVGKHPNAGKGRDRGESVIADTHEARGQDASLRLEGCVKHMTYEAQHEAGLQRGGSGFRGPWQRSGPWPCQHLAVWV